MEVSYKSDVIVVGFSATPWVWSSHHSLCDCFVIDGFNWKPYKHLYA